jgi:hypothetical protein
MSETRLNKANELFEDVKDFFNSETNRKYLVTLLSNDDVREILSEIELCFIETEDFEKCAQIVKWKNMLK